MKPKPRKEIKQALAGLRYKRFCNSQELPNPPKGKCKWCGSIIKNGRRVWCSDACQTEAYVRFGFYFANALLERDKGVCAYCGIDCVWLQREVKRIKKTYKHMAGIRFKMDKEAWGPWWTYNRRLWEADHILPVSKGGGCCGLDNYRTLCLKCHKEETAKLAKNNSTKPQQKGLFD